MVTPTDLINTLSPNHRLTFAEYKRLGYGANGWNYLRRWDGQSLLIETAGIAGPSRNEGSWAPSPVGTANDDLPGERIFRYRYKDSRTGYVSNPSLEAVAYDPSLGAVGQLMVFLVGAATAAGASITNVAITLGTTLTRGAGSWVTDGLAVGDYPTFSNCEDAANNGTFGPITSLSATVMVIASGGLTNNADDDSLKVARSSKGRIQASSDAKVDRIVLEGTIAQGGDKFFIAVEALNTATTITTTLADAELERRFLPWPNLGHDVPPVTRYCVSHRERLWLFGQVTHAIGTAAFTNASATVGQGTAPDWNSEVLGGPTQAIRPSVNWRIRATGNDENSYEIDYFDGTNIIMRTVYLDGTETVAYQIFSTFNGIWISNPGYPEGFTLFENLNGPNGEQAGALTAGIGYGAAMIFFSATCIYRFSYDTNPFVDGFMQPLTNKAGALSQRVVVEVDGTIYTMDARGWWAFDGVTPRLISRPLGPIRSSLDFTYVDRFFAVYLPESRAIRWYVTYTGDTYPKNYVQLDIDTGAWSTGSHLMGMTDGRIAADTADKNAMKLLLLDENGYSWWADTGLADGCPAANSHLNAVFAGSTATIFNVAETLPTTGTGLAGMYATRRIAAGATESRRISSNTAGAITLASAFTSVPAQGEDIWIGAIPTQLKTRAFGAKVAKDKFRTGTLTIQFKPTTSTRYLQVRVYEDYSATAKVWGTRVTARPGLVGPGQNTAYPVTDYLVDLSYAAGIVTINVGQEWKRFLEVALIIEEPDADFYLISVNMDGDELEEAHR